MVEMEAAYEAPGGILAEDVGRGKTFIAAGLMRESPLWPTLVVVPKATLWEWVDVIRTVGVDAFPNVILKATHAEDAAKADLVVTTHAMFGRRDVPLALRTNVWGRVIVDEAHVIRNVATLVHKALASLKSHAKWALTATPMQNCDKDLLALARFVGLRKMDDADAVRDGCVYRTSPPPDSSSSAAPRTIHPSHPPKLTIQTVRVALGLPGERELYDKAEAEWAADDYNMACVLRCRQAATHPAIYYRSVSTKKGITADEELACLEEARRWQTASSSKLNHLTRDLEGHCEKAIVFCDWIDEMKVIRQHLASRGIECETYEGKLSLGEREDVLARFRDPMDLRVLLIQIQCGACGLNLQSASRVYIMRPQWNPAVEHQAIGRAARSGQRNHVVAQRLVAEDTIDDVLSLKQRDKLRVITRVLRDDSMERNLWPSSSGDEI